MRIAKIIIPILLLFTACKPHKLVLKQSSSVNDGPILDPNKKFNTQGEVEKYWTEELFKQKYKKEKFDRYNGEVKVIDSNHILFDKMTVELFSDSSSIKNLFTSGVLYPKMFVPVYDIKVSGLEEITFVNHSDTVRRFTFDVFNTSFSNPKVYMMNPVVYYIELTNTKASNKTDLANFVKDAELTFFFEGGVRM